MPRTMEDINKEYANTAMAHGQVHFQINQTQEQLEKLEYEAEKLSNKMASLNKEALKLNEEKKEEAPSEKAPDTQGS